MNLKVQNITKHLLAVLMFFIACPAYANNYPTDAILAVVNDDVITFKDLRQYISGIASQLKVENKSPEEIQHIMMDYEQKGLDKLIEDRLILAAANDKGIEVRDEVVDKRLQDIKGRYSSETEFLKALDGQGMTVGDLRQNLTDQFKIKYEIDMEIRDKIEVNPQDVTDYYNQHIADFSLKPSVNLQSIFVSFNKYDKTQARSRADEARSRLLAGEPFDTISQKYSDAPSIGEIEKGQMADTIEDVIFNLQLDAVSDPIEVADGIYVFKVIEISPGKQQALSEVKDKIYNKLLDDQFQAKFKDWVAKLREKAYVEIK